MVSEVKPASSTDSPDTPMEPAFEMVGIMPAAGYARRLGETSGTSKELLPVPDEDGQKRPVSHFLLRQMVHAECNRAFIVIRPGKWDIPGTLGDRFAQRLPLAYCTIGNSWGPPFTLAQALPFAPGAGIATGFPDILIEPPDAMGQIVDKLRASQADVVVATFAASEQDGCDLCMADADDRVYSIRPKEEKPDWQADSQTWLLAAWKPTFSRFFVATLETFATELASRPSDVARDLPLGAIMSRALAAGYQIQRVHFPAGRFLDIGSPQRLLQAGQFFSRSHE